MSVRRSLLLVAVAPIVDGCDGHTLLGVEPCAAAPARCNGETALDVCLDGQWLRLECAVQCPAGAVASCVASDGLATCDCRAEPVCDASVCLPPLACREDGSCGCGEAVAVCTSTDELTWCPHPGAELAVVDCATTCADQGLVGRCVAEPTATCQCEPLARPADCGPRECGPSPSDSSLPDACGICADGLACASGRCLPLAADPRVGCCLDHREVTFARADGSTLAVVACGLETSCGWDPALEAYGCVPAPGGPDPSGAHPQFCPAPWSRPPCADQPPGGYCAALGLACGPDGCGGSCGACSGTCDAGTCTSVAPTPRVEICNGVDDDLDGTTDLDGRASVCGNFALCLDETCLCFTSWSEGWPTGWEPCRAPGACVPDPGGETSTCSAPPTSERHCAPGSVPGLSSVWRIDESGRLLEIEPCGPCACVGAACVRQAPSELCEDAIDNDCNGLTDTNDPTCPMQDDEGANP